MKPRISLLHDFHSRAARLLLALAVLLVSHSLFASPPSITASKDDNTAPGVKKNPGEQITYTITIGNSNAAGTDDATGVMLNDAAPTNTTDVANTLSVTPVAIDDTYPQNVVANMSVDTATSGFTVVTNDFAGYSGGSAILVNALTITAFDATSAHGGTVTMVTSGATVGRFTYAPAPGYTGPDSFTYTIGNGVSGTPAGSNVGTVTLNVVGPVIWFANSTTGNDTTGKGTLALPYKTLTKVATVDAAHQKIFAESNGATPGSYTAGIALESGQVLAGQGAVGTSFDTLLLGFTPGTDTPARPSIGGTRPNLSNGSGNAITLAEGNTIVGLNVIGASTSGIAGTNINSVTIGNATTSDVSISGTTGNGILLSGGSGTCAINAPFTTTAGHSININTRGAGAITFSQAISDSGTGILLDNNDASGNATINFTGGITLTTGANDAFTAINGGVVNVSGTNNITTTGGKGINWNADTSTTGVTFNNVNSTSGGAVIIASSGASDFTFNNVTSTTGTAVSITTATGDFLFHAINANGASKGITVNSATGTFTVTGTGGSGLCDSTHLGVNDCQGGTIQNISARGAEFISSNNVTLKNMYFKNANMTDGANPAVSPSTCGDVASSTDSITGCNASIYLSSIGGATVPGIFMDKLYVDQAAQMGINGIGVAGFKLTNSTVQNAGNQVKEAGITIRDLTGTSSMQNNVLQADNAWPLRVQNYTGSLTFTIDNVTFNGIGKANTTSQDGFLFGLSPGATGATITVQNSRFYNNHAYGSQMDDSRNSAPASPLTVTFNNNDFGQTNGATVSNSNSNGMALTMAAFGQLDYTITNNRFYGQDVIGIVLSESGSAVGSARISGTISSNTIGDNAVPNSGAGTNGNGIQINGQGAGSVKANIVNNTISQVQNTGINIETMTNSSVGNFHIKGNTLNPATTINNFAISIWSGNTSADTSNVCAEIGGTAPADKNTINGLWSGNVGIRTRQRFTMTTYNVSGFTGTANSADSSQLQTYIAARNNMGSQTVSSSTNTAYVNTGATCSNVTPLLFAQGGVEKAEPLACQESGSDAGVAAAVNFAPELRKNQSVARSQEMAKVYPLSQPQLDALVAIAKQRWAATGITAEQNAALDGIKFAVADLPELYLGSASTDRVELDRNANGRGWFVDPAPSSDSQFSKIVSPTLRYTEAQREPAGRIDLLTAIMHEMGHALGLRDIYAPDAKGDIMYGFLTIGQRRLPRVDEAKGAIPGTATHAQYLADAVNIGTLPKGKSVVVTFNVLIGAGTTAPSISNQGTVTGGNFSDVLTNIEVTPVEQPPTVSDVSVSVDEDAEKTFAASDFAPGFNDPNPGDSVQKIKLTSLPAKGVLKNNNVAITPGDLATLEISDFALLTYKPNADYNGSDSFGWNGSDGSQYAASGATVNITVNPTNDPVTASVPGAFSVAEDSSNTAVSGMSIADVDTTLAPNGVYEVTLSAAHGAMTMTTLTGLTFTAGDGTSDASMTFHGTLSDINSGLATAAYRPNADYNGSDTITLNATDTFSGVVATGSGAATSDNKTVGVTVTAVNDPVAATVPASITLAENSTNFGVSGMSISDVDATLAPSGIYEVTLSSTHGTMTLSTIAGLAFTVGDGSDDATMTFHGTPADINTALATAKYSTESNYFGSAQIQLAVTDEFSGVVATGTGPATSDTKTVAVTITEICTASPVVTNTNDTGAGSLREAVTTVCTGDTITFNIPTADPNYNAGTNTHTITLSSQLVLAKNVTINGPNTDASGSIIKVSGNDAVRVFGVNSGITATINSLTIANGMAAGDYGGGINNAGSLTLNFCDITGNNADYAGGILNDNNGVLTVRGSSVTANHVLHTSGGIYNRAGATLKIVDSTISGNSADDNSGGVLNEAGTLEMLNSTVSGNSCKGDGAGVYNYVNGTSTLTNVTITLNRADSDGGGGGIGGGVYNPSGTTTLKNTIVAGNLVGTGVTPADVNGPVNANYCLIGDTTGATITGGNNLNGDAKLNILGDYGGPTLTHQPKIDSPVLDAGNNAFVTTPLFATPFKDQRGFDRIVDSPDSGTTATVDIGAVEANYTIAATAGTPQSATVLTAFASPLEATVSESGIGISGVTVIFTAPAAQPTGTFTSSPPYVTDANGLVQATMNAGTKSGSYAVTATAAGYNGTANFQLTNIAGSADHFAITAPTSATAGSPFSITVTALDANGNVDTNYAGKVSFSKTDSGAGSAIPADYIFVGGDNGAHTFSNGVTLVTAGTRTVAVKDVANNAITGSANVSVVAADATHLSVVAPGSAASGNSFTFTVTALDQFDNTDTNYGGLIQFTSTDGSASLPSGYTYTGGDGGTHMFAATLNTAGAQTITATDADHNSVKGTSANISVAAGAANHFQVTAPVNTIAGAGFNLTVTVRDAANNLVSDYVGTVQITSTDPQAVLPTDYPFVLGDAGSHTFSGVTLKTAGVQTITAADAGNNSVTGAANVNVDPDVPHHLAVSAPASATVNATFNFTVTSVDQFDNPSPAYLGTVHFTSSAAGSTLPADYTFVGADNGAHQFTAALGTSGNQSLTATDKGTPTITGTANILVGEPPAITSADHTTFKVGSAGTFAVTTTGNPTNASMSITETGALPGGVTFVNNNDGTATLAGTPDAGTGGTYPITIKAANGIAPDATQSFTLTVDQAPAITSADHTTFNQGSVGSFTVTTTGFPTGASMIITRTGALPPGVNFVDNGDGTATLSGTPGASGTFPLTVHADNGVTPAASQSFTLTVNPLPAPTPTATAAATATATPTATAAPSATPTASPTATPTATPAQALNISTRLRVDTGDKVMIAGFIITGNASKAVVLRGMGPSLVGAGLPADAVLNDPFLGLHGPNGALIVANDNWKESPQKAQIENTIFQPTDDRESVIIATLQPGAYTVIISGVGGTSGIGLIEVYDNNGAVNSVLANISTRGFVQTGNEVMIGGFTLGGNNNPARIAVRALGPSLSISGLANLLADPTLELHNADGTIMISNDDWQSDPVSAAQLTAAGLALPDPKEAGIFTALAPPGQFTAIVVGKDGGIGIALVEIYNLK